jgi:hypothetical protein
MNYKRRDIGEGTQAVRGHRRVERRARDGENSANKRRLTFSLSCCFRRGPLWRLHRQNMTHFLSLDELRAWRERESRGQGNMGGQTQAKRLANRQ